MRPHNKHGVWYILKEGLWKGARERVVEGVGEGCEGLVRVCVCV